MELTQVEKMMVAAKQQMILRIALDDKYRGTRRNLPILDDVCDLADKEYNAITEEVYNNFIHYSGEIHKLRELLARAYEQLCLLGYDSCFTNDEINKLTNDISEYFGGVE